MRTRQPACTIGAHDERDTCMIQALAIATGGALGALLRYWTSLAVHSKLGAGFPYGTLTVNVIGSLLMGFLYIWFVERLAMGPVVRGFLFIGVLGAFTTFSTFSLETMNLIESGQLGKAVLNVVISVIVCVTAAGLGVLAARQI